MKILLAEDETAMQRAIQAFLGIYQYEVDLASDGAEAVEMAENGLYDCYIFDIMMPNLNGIDALKKLRNAGDTTPAIFLTAKVEVDDRVTGLEAGADDYLTKPFAMKELLARVAVNIRRYTQARQTSQENSNRVVTFGNTAFDGEAFVLTQHGEKLDCTTSELRLLRFLLQHRGQVISRSAIMEQLYDIDGEFFEDNTLSVYIKRLRQKLGEDGAYIETVRGMGYRFRK